MTSTTQTAMQALLELGQSVWLDYLRRGMLRSGELQALIDDGLRGMTSNPTIFEHAIGGSSDYDDGLRAIAASPKTDLEVFERLAVEDVREAADLFRPVYDATEGRDGFVSLEVSPTLARDTERTIAEARRLWARGGSAQSDDQGARHQGRLARNRAPPHRWRQRQHHPALLAGALPSGGRGVPASARDPGAARSADRSPCFGGLVLREPGGHRDRSPDRSHGCPSCGIFGARSRWRTPSWPTSGFARC